jgi:hypothetical protein
LVVQVLGEASGDDIDARIIVAAFFRDRFGGPADYLTAVSDVWGAAARFLVENAISNASPDARFPLETPRRVSPEEASARELLLQMPESDFRLAVEAVVVGGPFEVAGRITSIDTPEFSGGVQAEFESARRELHDGRQSALKQAVHEAGCAVESAMKVLLEAHGVAFDADHDAAGRLFESLVEAGVVPRHMQNFVLSPVTPRNRRGGHGAGAVPHAVELAEAEAMVAGAAASIAYLAKLLR